MHVITGLEAFTAVDDPTKGYHTRIPASESTETHARRVAVVPFFLKKKGKNWNEY